MNVIGSDAVKNYYLKKPSSIISKRITSILENPTNSFACGNPAPDIGSRSTPDINF